MLFYSTICRWLFLFFQKCVKDTLSPIIIKLNFSQDDNGGKSGILNVDSKRQAVVEVCTTEGCWQSHKCASCLDKEKHQSCAQYKAHILRCEMEFCFMDVMMTFLNLSFFKLFPSGDLLVRKAILFIYCVPKDSCIVYAISFLVCSVFLNDSFFQQVPFEKTCRLNDTCIAELEVDFM